MQNKYIHFNVTATIELVQYAIESKTIIELPVRQHSHKNYPHAFNIDGI